MNKFDQYIQEMAYPSSFRFPEFENIKSYAGKLRYANERLQKIASGSARVVYKVDDEKVLKIAKNRKGLAQNSVESEYYLDSYDICAKTFEADPKDYYVEMEFAKKISPSRFKQITGIDIKIIKDYINTKRGEKYGIKLSPEVMKKLDDNNFLINLTNLIFDYDMIVGDLDRISSYGEVIRDGEPAVVLVDFGLTKSVYEDFYKVGH